MKSFAVALCVFAFLLVAIFYNFHFVNSTADELERRLAAVEPGQKEALNALCDFWKERKKMISCSVANQCIQDLQLQLTALRLADSFRDPAEFQTRRALALEAVADLRRLERFSAENIL